MVVVRRLAHPGFQVPDANGVVSGQPRTSPGERPHDPQLPLYAAGFLLQGADSGLGAVSYACLRSGEMGFRGLGEGGGIPDPLQQPGTKQLKGMPDMTRRPTFSGSAIASSAPRKVPV